MKRAVLCLCVAAVCAVAAALPAIPQDPGYHLMADRRALGGIPNAADVLSNVPFAIVGIAGLVLVRRRPWPWAPFFAATALTSIGSAYYHLAPDNARVVWDRLPIAIACACLVVAVVHDRVSATAARALFPSLTAVAVTSVFYWYRSELAGRGDLRPYAVVQFGSLVVLAAILALYREPRRETAFLAAGLAAYGAAKAFELSDAAIFAAGRIVSGHTLKHVAAAAGVACVWAVLRARAEAQRVRRSDSTISRWRPACTRLQPPHLEGAHHERHAADANPRVRHRHARRARLRRGPARRGSHSRRSTPQNRRRARRGWRGHDGTRAVGNLRAARAAGTGIDDPAG
jgi:uncharacterized protein DUF6962